MKTVSHHLIKQIASKALVLFFLTLVGCNLEEKVLPAVAEELRLGPKILSLKIPGVPAENIEIDHEKNQIVVTVPAGLIDGAIDKVEFTIAEGADWTSNEPDVINLCSGVVSHSWPGVTTTDFEFDDHTVVIEKKKIRRTYRIVIRQKEAMYFTSADKNIEIDKKFGDSYLPYLSVSNISDGDGTPIDILITNVKTGQQFIQQDYSCGKVSVRMPESLVPGEYTIQIKKKNGRKTTNQVHVLLKVGSPYVQYIGGIVLSNSSSDMQIRGANLFENTNIEVEIWHNRTGERYRVKPTLNDPTGREGTLPKPSNIKAGNYYYKVFFDGKPQEKGGRLVVRANEKQPVISLGYILGEPVTLIRNKIMYGITYSPVLPNSSPQIKLTSVDDKMSIYLIDILTLKGMYTTWPDNYYFTTPWNMPLGRYILTMQHRDEKGVLYESEPSETDIIIE